MSSTDCINDLYLIYFKVTTLYIRNNIQRRSYHDSSQFGDIFNSQFCDNKVTNKQ